MLNPFSRLAGRIDVLIAVSVGLAQVAALYALVRP